MKFTIFGLLLFLAACNGSTEVVQKVPYSDPALVAKIAALTQALAAATHEDAQRFDKLQLVGRAHGVASAERTLAIGQAAVVPPNFGPCTDMGVLEGETTDQGNGTLGATYQAFKNCMGIHAEYAVDTGDLKIANRVYFTSSDCSGLPVVWQAGGQGYNSQILNDGVVFISPVDGKDYLVPPLQSPQITQVGSVYVVVQGVCETDGDLQPMWTTVPNDTSKSGVPTSVGAYHITSP